MHGGNGRAGECEARAQSLPGVGGQFRVSPGQAFDSIYENHFGDLRVAIQAGNLHDPCRLFAHGKPFAYQAPILGIEENGQDRTPATGGPPERRARCVATPDRGSSSRHCATL